MNTIKKLVLIAVTGFIVSNSNVFAAARPDRSPTMEDEKKQIALAVDEEAHKIAKETALIASINATTNQTDIDKLYHQALMFDHSKALALFFDTKKTTLEKHPESLRKAVEFGSIQCILLLITRDADVNYRSATDKQYTPFRRAGVLAYSEALANHLRNPKKFVHISSLRALLAAGASDNLDDEKNAQALVNTEALKLTKPLMKVLSESYSSMSFDLLNILVGYLFYSPTKLGAADIAS